MDFIYYFMIGVKGFVIAFGFCISALLIILMLCLIFSLFGLGKGKNND